METTETVIDRLIAYVTENCKTVDLEDRYDDMLNECYSLKSVGGPFAYMDAAQVLKEMDPTAYRCGMNDWADGEGFFEIGGENYEAKAVEDAQESFLDELDSEIQDKENEIEEMEADEDPSQQDIAELQRDLDSLREDHKLAKAHTF